MLNLNYQWGKILIYLMRLNYLNVLILTILCNIFVDYATSWNWRQPFWN